MKPDLLRPTLTAGLLFGIASGLPGLGCCCCLWFLAAGWLGALLFVREGRRLGYPLRVSDGAMVGLVAGLFGGFASWVVQTLLELLFGEQMREFLLSFLEPLFSSSGLPPELQHALEQARQGFEQGPSVPGMIFSLLATLFFFALLSTISGLLTVALIGRGPGSPIAPPPVPPGGWQGPGGQTGGGWQGPGGGWQAPGGGGRAPGPGPETPPSGWGPGGGQGPSGGQAPGGGSPQEPPASGRDEPPPESGPEGGGSPQ